MDAAAAELWRGSGAGETTVLSPSALPTRRWRQRAKNGRCLLKVEVDEAALCVALVDAGLLAVDQADRRDALTAATQQLLQKFCAGETSRHGPTIDATVKIGLLLRALRNASRTAAS